MLNNTVYRLITWMCIILPIGCKASSDYRKLNRKLTYIQKALESEISDVKYEIFDLRTEVELL